MARPRGPVLAKGTVGAHERLGALYDVRALSEACQIPLDDLRQALEQRDVPIVHVLGRDLAPADLAERALGLAGIPVVREVEANRAWLRQQRYRPDGTAKGDNQHVQDLERLGGSLLGSRPSALDR